MKKAMTGIILAIFALCSGQAFAQHSINGIWEGRLKLDIELRLVFHFSTDSNGKWTAVLNSPDQSPKDIACSGVSIYGDSIRVDVASVGGHYLGKIFNDSLITGAWSQGGNFQLDLHKVDKVSELLRPQTPKPPFSYRSEEVEYDNAGKTIHYGATITTPPGKGPFPALVMITGSGQQDRNEEISGHQPFAVIADWLTRHGYIVLRADDRGIGKSTGDFSKSTSEDFEKDVEVHLDYLGTRKEVDRKKIGLIGHSEGGMVAPMVAVRRSDVSFIVLLAGPGVKIFQLMEDQTAAVLKSAGIIQSAIDDYRLLYHKLLPAVVNAENKKIALENLQAIASDWQKNTKAVVVRATTGITNDSTRNVFVETMVNILYTPWFIYFLKYDPAPVVEQLSCKVLALNGEKDIQVLAKPNLAGLESALKKSKSKSYQTKEIPGLNHLFQHCKSCSVAEYGKLQETFSPEVLDLITQWLNKEVKK
jgi:alpha/beta superfamily hydrolase